MKSMPVGTKGLNEYINGRSYRMEVTYLGLFPPGKSSSGKGMGI